jgi:hypothetical protein
MTLHPDVQAFANLLQEIEAMLRDQKNEFWAAHIARCLNSIERSDAHGLQRYLSLLGGMGSLNDVSFSRGEDPLIAENDRFRTLLTRAYEAARRLERNN